MPSTRRTRVFAIAALALVIIILYFSVLSLRPSRDGLHRTTDVVYQADARRSQNDFYHRTIAAIEAKTASQVTVTDSEISQKLRDAADAAKKVTGPGGPAAPALALDRPSIPDPSMKGDDAAVGSISGDKSVAGRIKPAGGEKWNMAVENEAPLAAEGGKMIADTVKTEKQHDVEVELNSILKKSPIIVFSKSYCPYSKKAKNVLLNRYSIVPAPYVVELDEHPLGSDLQAALEASTGRRTVPNVLINGKSIGGGDDVEALDSKDELIEKVRSMGGKRIMEAKLRGV